MRWKMYCSKWKYHELLVKYTDFYSDFDKTTKRREIDDGDGGEFELEFNIAISFSGLDFVYAAMHLYSFYASFFFFAFVSFVRLLCFFVGCIAMFKV